MTWLPLVLKYWQGAAIAALLGFGAFEWHEHSVALIDKGRAEERARVADSALKVLGPLMAHADTVFRRDTVRLAKTVQIERVTHDTVLNHLTDTVLVKQVLAQDTVNLRACVETVNHCAANIELRDREITALRQKLDVAPTLLPVRHWYSDRLAVGPCAGVSYKGQGFIGGCGLLAIFRGP